MAKPTKPQWAYGDSSYRIEPSTSKKQTGWLSAEKPPFQYMNWIHYQNNSWIDYFETKVENIYPTMMRSAGTLTWNGSTLTFGSAIDVSFRVTTGQQINRIPTSFSALAIADGEVVVLRKHKTGSSPVSVTAAASYATLDNGQLVVVAESSLTAVQEEYETILFRRSGSTLEIPLHGIIYASGTTFTLGQLLSHTHDASDITSGTFADARIAASNVTQHQAALALAASQITSGTFADARIAASNVTQHQAALSIAYSQLTSVPGFLITDTYAFSDINSTFNLGTGGSETTFTDVTGCSITFTVNQTGRWMVNFCGVYFVEVDTVATFFQSSTGLRISDGSDFSRTITPATAGNHPGSTTYWFGAPVFLSHVFNFTTTGSKTVILQRKNFSGSNLLVRTLSGGPDGQGVSAGPFFQAFKIGN